MTFLVFLSDKNAIQKIIPRVPTPPPSLIGSSDQRSELLLMKGRKDATGPADKNKKKKRKRESNGNKREIYIYIYIYKSSMFLIY